MVSNLFAFNECLLSTIVNKRKAFEEQILRILVIMTAEHGNPSIISFLNSIRLCDIVAFFRESSIEFYDTIMALSREYHSR